MDVLPSNWQNISNFHVLPDSELKKHGWLPVEEIETRQQPIKITYGYSRDRRPDLKQFMIVPVS